MQLAARLAPTGPTTRVFHEMAHALDETLSGFCLSGVTCDDDMPPKYGTDYFVTAGPRLVKKALHALCRVAELSIKVYHFNPVLFERVNTPSSAIMAQFAKCTGPHPDPVIFSDAMARLWLFRRALDIEAWHPRTEDDSGEMNEIYVALAA